MKPIVLCILDGFGIGDNNDKFNAITQAKMPNYQRFLATYPHSKLQTSGLSVGLPEGQIGNSEVGHMTIGAGRIIYQDLPKINKALIDGSLVKNQDLARLITDLKSKRRPCHLMGLFSDGGVHSHYEHIIFIANHLAQNQIEVFIHAFLDGRDVGPQTAKEFFITAKKKLHQQVKFASISGRYYAMDRDKKWDRIKLATDSIISGLGPNFNDPLTAIDHNYKQNITDEFLIPCTIENFKGINNDDGLIFANFRADRARQISQELFKNIKFSNAIAFCEYSKELNQYYKILFPHQEINNSLAEILARNQLRQLRLAETEKYAHVTFFFSCGREKEFENEERILVQSPLVATYDLKPEMSANELTNHLTRALKQNKFDFIVVNYANPDMVGHSGNMLPSIKACEAIDKQLGILEQEILKQDGNLLICADHGNIECMRDKDNQPHTAHTTNPVPFIFINRQHHQFQTQDGALNDIAPTILKLLKIAIPNEMDGKNLIVEK